MSKTLKYITAKAKSKDKGELMIYGDISDVKWYEEDVTPKDIDTALKDLTDCKEIDIYINSYGGSVFAGLAIVSMLERCTATKTVYIDGIAASMGSVIAMAGDKIIMPENALMMIHKPSGCAFGNADDMRKQADMLDKAEDTLCSLYMKRFNKSETELKDLLKAETWLNSDEALFYGLIDSVSDALEMVASAKGLVFNKLEIDKENPIYNKLKPKGDITNLEILATIKKQFGVDIKSDETLENALTAISKNYKEPEKVDIKIVDNEDGSKSVMNGDVELKKFDMPKAEMDAELTEKAKQFDEIKSTEIENALKNGIKAKGETFDNDLWEKTLKGFSIDEIKKMSDGWVEDAKLALNAGTRKTENQTNIAVTKKFNVNDFKL